MLTNKEIIGLEYVIYHFDEEYQRYARRAITEKDWNMKEEYAAACYFIGTRRKVVSDILNRLAPIFGPEKPRQVIELELDRGHS